MPVLTVICLILFISFVFLYLIIFFFYFVMLILCLGICNFTLKISEEMTLLHYTVFCFNVAHGCKICLLDFRNQIKSNFIFQLCIPTCYT